MCSRFCNSLCFSFLIEGIHNAATFGDKTLLQAYVFADYVVYGIEVEHEREEILAKVLLVMLTTAAN